MANLHAPSLRQLRAFLAVAETGSFSQAAQALSLTQPAVSASIRELESLLGARLMDRGPHHMALTEAGRTLLHEAQWLVASFDRGVGQMHAMLASGQQTVRIACLPSAMHLLAPVLARWQAQNPQVKVEVSDPLHEELIAQLRSGAVDMGITTELDTPARLHTTALAEDELVVLLPPGHRLAQTEGPLRWKALRGERLVLFARGSTYELAVATLRQQRIAMDDAMRMRYSESLYSLVQAGHAVGVISRLYTQGVATPALQVRSLTAPVIGRRLALMLNGEPAQQRAVVAQCRSFLCEQLLAGE
ncbi:MAG: LysR family transcriptional regulator [Comamonas sp.]